MRTLTTSFENALKKELGTQSYIIRMEGIKKSDLSMKVFYFSNDFEEVDYTAVSGQLMDCEALKQVVDFYSGSYSFGGTDIKVMHLQDMMNDVIKDYNFRNQKCEIYYWCEGQDKRTNQDINFTDSRLVADSNILDGATEFEIERKFKTGASVTSTLQTLASGIEGVTGKFGALRFNDSALYISLQDGSTSANTYSTPFSFLSNTEYLVKVKKIGTLITYDINGTTDTDTTTSVHNISIIEFGCYLNFQNNYYGTDYYSKIWSGGDRNTGTLVCNLVGKDNAPLDLAGNFTFTEYNSGAGDITYTDNLQRYSKGIIDNVISDKDVVDFKYVNDTRITDQMFPPLINDSDAGDANGKVSQLVYGAHAMNYGSTNPSQKNNMVKGIYQGIVYDANGFDTYHRWIIAGNGSDVTINAAGASSDYYLWFWSSEVKRYLQILSYSVGTDTQGNKYVDIPISANYIVYAYDFLYPIMFGKNAGTPNWSDAVNIIGDPSDYAGVTFDNQATDAQLYCYMPDTADYTIVDKYLQGLSEESNTTNYEVTGFDSAVSIGTGAFNQVVTGAIPDYLTVIAQEGSGAATGYARMYYMCVRVKYEITGILDLYAECTNSIDTQREIISDIASEIGMTYLDNTGVPALTIAPVLYSQKKAIDWIKEIGKQGACVPYVNANNELTIDNVNFTDTSDYEFQVKDIEKIYIEPVGISAMINDMEINYYDDNFKNGLTDVTSDTNTDSIAIYGTWKGTMKADFYTAVPSSLLDYYVNGTTDTLFSEPRTRINFWTKNIRGIIPYDASGNLKTIASLEIGDHFTINSAMDDYIKLDGDTWANKLFKIDGYAIECGRVWIRGLYIRTLS